MSADAVAWLLPLTALLLMVLAGCVGPSTDPTSAPAPAPEDDGCNEKDPLVSGPHGPPGQEFHASITYRSSFADYTREHGGAPLEAGSTITVPFVVHVSDEVAGKTVTLTWTFDPDDPNLTTLPRERSVALEAGCMDIPATVALAADAGPYDGSIRASFADAGFPYRTGRVHLTHDGAT